jgi:hypothetical protein
LCSHLPEKIYLFQRKASGDTLKIQKPPATLIYAYSTSVHTYKKYLNPSGDPVPLIGENLYIFSTLFLHAKSAKHSNVWLVADSNALD